MTSINFSDLLRKERQEALKKYQLQKDHQKQELEKPKPKQHTFISQEKLFQSQDYDELNTPEKMIGNLSGLEKYKLNTPVPELFYVPNFISQTLHDKIIDEISLKKDWKEVRGRKLIYFGGTVNMEGILEKESIEEVFFRVLNQKLKEQNVFTSDFNHVLVNYYQSGQGIMFHEDGPIYIPHVAIISLCSPTFFCFKPRLLDGDTDRTADDVEKSKFCVFVEPNSLLIFSKLLYTSYLHGIEEHSISFPFDDSLESSQIQGPQKIEKDSELYKIYRSEVEEYVSTYSSSLINPKDLSPYLSDLTILNNQEKSNCFSSIGGKRISLTLRIVRKVRNKQTINDL